MAVAETGEGGLVPVLDDCHPGVAEGLSRRGSERGIDADRVVVRGVKRVSELVETELRRIAFGLAVALLRPRCDRHFVGRFGNVDDAHGFLDVRERHTISYAETDRVVVVGIALADAFDLVDEEGRIQLDGERLRAPRGDVRNALGQGVVDEHLQMRVGRNSRLGLNDDELRRRLVALLVPIGGEEGQHRLPVARRRGLRFGHLRIERGHLLRLELLQPLARRQLRRFEFMRDGAQFEMRPERLRIDRLIEPERDDDAAVPLVILAIPVGAQQLNGRRDEREVVGVPERLPADRFRISVDRDVVLGRERQRRFRIGREDQRGRPRPAKRPLDRRRDMKPGDVQHLRNLADDDHRLAEHDPDLIGLCESGDFANRPRFDDGQLVRRMRGERAHK